MSLTVCVPTHLLLAVPGVEISSYIPLSDVKELSRALDDGDEGYIEYLLEPQHCITVPYHLRRDFEFTEDRKGMIFTYLSSCSLFRYFLKDLCHFNGVDFNEV